mgnify:FL=1
MVYRKASQRKRLEKLKAYYSDLREMKVSSYEEYLKDKKSRYSIERLLLLIAEAILDFLDHLLASQHRVVSDSYEEIIENARKYKVISLDLYDRLKGLGGFRNVLAHGYLKLDDQEVFKNYQKMLEIADEVLAEFEKTV